jgi:polysaccharide biosynthesis transport protein
VISQTQNDGASGPAHFHGEIEMLPSAGMMPENVALILWRSRWIVLATTVAALATALIYVTKATPIYTSTSRIYVEQSGPKIFTEREEGVMTQSKNYLYTQAELLKSTPILSTTFENPDLQKMQTFFGVDNAVSYMKNVLDITVGKRDDILSISFDSPYPAEAAQVVNAVVEAYIKYQETRKKSTSADILKILQAAKDKYSEELTQKLKAMADFKNDHPALALESQQGNNIINIELDRWSTALTEAQKDASESRSFYESTKKMIDDSVTLKRFVEAQRARGAGGARDSEEADLKSRLAQLQNRRADRLRRITSDHPAVKALDAEIADLRSQIARLDKEFAQSQLAVAEQQYLDAKERESDFARRYQEQSQQAIELNKQLTQYRLLESNWDRAQKEYDSVVQQYKNVDVTADVGALNITILEYARPADTPSRPQKSRYMAIALVMGLMLGGGLGLLRNFMDQTLRSADEISAVLGMPVLGVVPSMSRRESVVNRGQKTHLDSNSQWAEAYRTIRTAVFFSAPKGEAKTILITSPTPGDGKTTLASNLGIAMAQAGQKVLIVDADFRKPMQHRIFQLNHKERGLSNILVGISTFGEAIQRTNVEGLDLLACGPSVPNPAEILNSESFAGLLERLTEKYDRIVLDSPPVMPVTDAQILGALCHVTLLVLRAEKSTRKVGQQARHGLLSVGAHVLGVIVNDVPKKGRFSYYGSYGYSYPDGRRKERTASKSLGGAVAHLDQDVHVIRQG